MDFTKIAELVIQLIDTYGVIGMVMLILFVLVIKFGTKLVEVLADKTVKDGIRLPNSNRKLRKDSIFKVNKILTDLMHKTQADHVALFEYHNGGYNLTGMPFLHFSLSIQRNNVGVEELSKDFDNVLVSAVPDFIKKVDGNDIYHVDNIKTLQSTFPRMYRELKQDQTSEVFFSCIEGLDDEIGFVMLSFKEPIKEKREKVKKELYKKIQKISTLLDLKRLS